MPSPRISRGELALGSVSLNALRAFEAAARHQSFTRAAEELSVTQAAISHQVRGLEQRIGVTLFRRSPSSLVLTDEALNILPALTDAFDRLNRVVSRFDRPSIKESLHVGVVGTFAVWLHDHLPDFHARHPFVELRIVTNNNKVDLAAESLDFAIRFGSGAWHGTTASKVMEAPMTPLCAPKTAARLRRPADLGTLPLLQSYRSQDWPSWLASAGADGVVARGTRFDSSTVMVQVAMRGDGVALAPANMFRRECAAGLLVQPFGLEVDVGAYWITRLMSRPETPAMAAFRDWLILRVGRRQQAEGVADAPL